MHTSLRQRRRALGLTQEEVARAIGLTRTAYTKLEQGHVRLTLRTAQRLAQALNSSVDSLFPAEVDGSASTANISRPAHKEEPPHVTRERHFI